MTTIVKRRDPDEFYHYGVKGMKWGVRRFHNKNGELVLPKDTVIKRVSISRNDPTYDNKKYVSINQENHSKWENYIGNGYLRSGKATFNQTYKTNKDLKIMSSVKQGELFTKMMLENKSFKEQAIRDIAYANQLSGLKPTNNSAENISRNIAIQTKTSKAFIEKVLNQRYDALVDTHGTNVSKDPLIVLNPDTNLTRIADPEYTQPVKDYLSKVRR